ncbi:hypothetical protein FisN_4Lh050 [Fistulifera solaris]|uniref:Nudix hydrolase domain-containing protein n=1 Tax=Fistulifera solaris TaxID=1519565 RepID=A0A1Z5KDA8_FISSO|nr:hypothetical protein FisN_4Lh050 [Fistulifera solaris]|eukprot:GAX24249.1 hypothetical protein FisN_4Lh050 [Fistulifera solaris]
MGSDDGSKAMIWREYKLNHAAMVGCFVLGIFVSTLYSNITSSWDSLTKCDISLGHYGGIEYRSSSTRGTPKCLIESKFMKIQQHAVQIEGSIIPDWLFMDYHDQINVLVQAPHQESWTEPHFYVFEQTKYALEDRLSLAVVGGIVEPNENPETAARREVSEEMHVICDNFHLLGRFRADVNRGAGWTFTYLALDCKPGVFIEEGSGKENEVGAPDTEYQDLTTISLNDLQSAVLAGKFLEIKWTATVAMSLLRLSKLLD